MRAQRYLNVSRLLLIWHMCWADVVTTPMEKAGIVKKQGNGFVKKFHTSPDAYLGWEVRDDGTIWFDLDCMDLDESQYCGFGFSKPGRPATGRHDRDIYTAHRDHVEDRHAASNWSAPLLDQHQDVHCDHCGVLDGRLHATFYRNLITSDDTQDVDIVNGTYRVGWAIGILRDGRVGAHNFTPRTDSEYMYINFIHPETTELPNFAAPRMISAAAEMAGTVQMAVLTSALLTRLLP